MAVALLFIGGAILAAAWLILPKMKDKLFGDKYEVQIEVLRVEEDDVYRDRSKTATVRRIITDLRMVFPYGRKPTGFAQLTVKDVAGKETFVSWPESLIWDDHPDKGVSVAEIKDVYFQTGFRKGFLHFDGKEAAKIELKDPPFNPRNWDAQAR
jgi:hypothetical protein